MKPKAIARRFGSLERYHLIGPWGFVSDDAEQTALVLQSLVLARREDGSLDEERFVRAFRRALFGWFLRLPFGIGLATLRACLKIALRLRRLGIGAAGNGAAMRAAVLGAALADDEEGRRRLGRRLAEVTHTDARAIEGALFVAELAALASRTKAAGQKCGDGVADADEHGEEEAQPVDEPLDLDLPLLGRTAKVFVEFFS